MSEFDIEFLSQKLSENPQSPLFARLADLFLQKEQHSEALKLCEEGIQQFPKYYAGYLVLGKVCLALKEYTTARDAFEQALELSPFNEFVAKLLAGVPVHADESVRTSDQTYFEPQPSAESLKEQITQQFSQQSTHVEVATEEEMGFSHTVEEQPVVQPTPIREITKNQNLPSSAESIKEQIAQQFAQQSTHVGVATEEEVGFSHTVEEQPVIQPTVNQETVENQKPEQRAQQSEEILPALSAPKFPSFDEYYSQNSPRAQSGTVSTLDEYLVENGSPSPLMQDENSAPQAEVTKEVPEPPLAQQEPTVEQHYEPEPVFTSPEQAQLFAEMTGETNVEEEPPAPTPQTTIDDLAEKLQKVERIVPQEQYQPPAMEETPEDQSAETEMVTPTLAEIYASQGEFGAAIQAYEILMFSHPGKTAEYQQRIRELQKKQMEKEGLI